MKASTRTPTKKQGQVLYALEALHAEQPDTWPSTGAVHMRLQVAHAQLKSLAAVLSQRDVFQVLSAFSRHGWVDREVSVTRDRDNEGSHLNWRMTPEGRDALQRALQANTTKEKQVDTTTQEPPTSTPPWDDAPTEPEQSGSDADEQALQELDEHVTGELEEPEDDNQPVNEGSNQLTLAIGGPKPIESVLKITGHQQSFGSTRQFKNLERIPITAWLEIREVAAPVQDNGKVKRVHKARLTQIEFDAELDA